MGALVQKTGVRMADGDAHRNGDGHGSGRARRLLIMARMAYASIGLGTALAVWLPDPDSFASPVAQFAAAAAPWVLVALGFSLWFASRNY